MRKPKHLPHCKPVQVNWVGIPGPPHAGWQCVAECPVYQQRIESYAAEAQRIVAARVTSDGGARPLAS